MRFARPHASIWMIPALLFTTTCLPVGAAYAEQGDTKQLPLIDRFLARNSAIASGSVQYQWTSISVAAEDFEEGQPWDWPDEKQVLPCELTVDGEKWAMRWPGHPNVAVHRRDFSAVYYETPQPDGSVYRSLVIDGPMGNAKPLELEGEHAPRYRILKAGALPSARMAAYLKKHRGRIEAVGQRTVNEIDTQLLRIWVPKEELQEVYSGLHPLFLEAEGMVLDFYVAPELGHAIVRIESSTPDGFWTRRYESTDFEEVADGIFFPKCYCRIGNFTDSGRGYFVYQYKILEVEEANQPVPESKFVISVPQGTRVRDSRPGQQERVFHLEQPASFSNPDELAGMAGSSPQ